MEQEELTELTVEEQLAKTVAALDRYKKENKKFREQIENNEDVQVYKQRAIKAEAKLALQGQGIKEPERVLNFMALDGVDFDDEGNLIGLDETLDTAKEALPELFDAKRRVGGQADIFADSGPKAAKSTTELQVERIFGKR